jgi:hypothetical protein
MRMIYIICDQCLRSVEVNKSLHLLAHRKGMHLGANVPLPTTHLESGESVNVRGNS